MKTCLGGTKYKSRKIFVNWVGQMTLPTSTTSQVWIFVVHWLQVHVHVGESSPEDDLVARGKIQLYKWSFPSAVLSSP